MASRITKNVERTEIVTISVNGKTVSAYAGETIASVLFVEGISAFYKTENNQFRGPFCNMGTCFECQVKLLHEKYSSSSSWVRACMILIEEGMVITTTDALTVAGDEN